MPHSKASPQKLRAQERRQKALELRREGETYDRIAARLRLAYPEDVSSKYQGPHAYRDVMAEVNRLNATLREEAAAVRQIALDRYDRLLRSVWLKAVTGEEADEWAFQRTLKILERIERIGGVYAPTQIDQSVHLGEGLTTLLEAAHARNGTKNGHVHSSA